MRLPLLLRPAQQLVRLSVQGPHVQASHTHGIICPVMIYMTAMLAAGFQDSAENHLPFTPGMTQHLPGRIVHAAWHLLTAIWNVNWAHLNTLKGLPVRCAYSIKATSSAPLKAMPMSSPNILSACSVVQLSHHEPDASWRLHRKQKEGVEAAARHVAAHCVT
jgi:hypothetical protein